MVSQPLDATPSASVDVPGLSVITAIASATNNRAGSIYDSALAGCVPIYTVPVDGTNWLMLFSRRWINATASSTQTGYYTSYTIDNNPGWMLINQSTGTRQPVDGTYNIPMKMARQSAVLTAACASPPYNTYLLNTVTDASGISAVLQNLYYNPVMKTFTMLSEEVIPNGQLNGPPVSLLYNVPGFDNIALNAEVAAKIFIGQITTWNHASIAALNTGITLPSTTIKPIYRSDANTTTGKFQSWLDASTSAWTKATGDTFTGGVGTGAAGAEGARLAVEATTGGITYLEKPYAAQSPYPEARFPTTSVRFDRGIFLHGDFIIAFGASTSGMVCMARKPRGRVGIDSTPWTYFDGSGWWDDPSEVKQALTTTGKLLSIGPISAFTFEQNRVRMATVTSVTMGGLTARYANVYSLTNSFKWQIAGSPILLGYTSDGSYQNGTLQFHPQLRVVESLIQTPEASTAIPYSYTTKVFGTNAQALRVNWGAWQISRLY